MPKLLGDYYKCPAVSSKLVLGMVAPLFTSFNKTGGVGVAGKIYDEQIGKGKVSRMDIGDFGQRENIYNLFLTAD